MKLVDSALLTSMANLKKLGDFLYKKYPPIVDINVVTIIIHLPLQVRLPLRINGVIYHKSNRALDCCG